MKKQYKKKKPEEWKKKKELENFITKIDKKNSHPPSPSIYFIVIACLVLIFFEVLQDFYRNSISRTEKNLIIEPHFIIIIDKNCLY